MNSLNENKGQWEERYEKIVPQIEQQIFFVEQMISSYMKHYDVNNISDFRLICLGYLIIAKNNLKATYCLVKQDLFHQAHFIRRNMFEMTLNLFYMDDNIDCARDVLVERYFDHGVVRSYDALKTMLSHPEGFEDVRNKVKDETVTTAYKIYLKKYGLAKKPQSWCDKTLDKMIARISNEKLRSSFLEEYDLLNKVDNWLLHPSAFYVKMAIEDEELNNNYAPKTALLSSMYQLTNRIIEKFIFENEEWSVDFSAKFKEFLRKFKEAIS